MKKLIKFLTIILCLTLLSSCMLACGDKGNGGNGDGEPTYTPSEGLEIELDTSGEESFAIVKSPAISVKDLYSTSVRSRYDFAFEEFLMIITSL